VFLAGHGAKPLETLSSVPVNHDYIGGMTLQAQTSPGGNPDFPSSLHPLHPTITINDNGFFFTNLNNLYRQGSTLLHELGHATGVLVPDGGDTTAALVPQKLNEDLLKQHCSKTLDALKNLNKK
jgi:hypothetical protein